VFLGKRRGGIFKSQEVKMFSEGIRGQIKKVVLKRKRGIPREENMLYDKEVLFLQ